MTELVAPEVVNTMPEKTLLATQDHGLIPEDSVTGSYAAANAVLAALAALAAQGVSYDDVARVLEEEGVSKFVISWNELLDTVGTALEGASAPVITR